MKYINLEYHPADSRIRIVDYDVSQTLNSRMGTGGGNVPLILELTDEEDTDNFKWPGGGVLSWNYQELAATLRAEMGIHQPIVVVKCEDDDSDRD